MAERRLTLSSPNRFRLRYAWRDTWSDFRNRLLGSPRFQQWASRFPLTRPIARWRARSLFDLCAGFVYSQILYACVQLRLFELLQDGPQELRALARQLALPEEKLARLVDAAVALDLLEQRGVGRYGLGTTGALLAADEGIRAMVQHHGLLYEDLREPVPLLRGDASPTRLGQYWPYAESTQAAELNSDQVRAYSELMATSQTLIAAEVLNACSLRGHRCLLDVGGGAGAFLAAVADRWPDLQLMLFDLPAVVEQARQRLVAEGVNDRLQVVGGDFFVDELPVGADVISLVRVIHDHNDEDVLHLLQKIHARLPAGGKLLLAEPMAGHKDSDRVANAYFAFYLLAMGKGRARTPQELGDLLHEAGFKQYRLVPNAMPLQTRIMVASK